MYLYYNADGRLINVQDENGRTATFTYDEKGHLLSKINADGVTKVTNRYEENGRVKKQFDAHNQVTKYSYEYSETDKTLTITSIGVLKL